MQLSSHSHVPHGIVKTNVSILQGEVPLKQFPRQIIDNHDPSPDTDELMLIGPYSVFDESARFNLCVSNTFDRAELTF